MCFQTERTGTSMPHLQIIANTSGKYRREKLEGRDHLVVPCVMLKEAVLEGSAGALYYPADEIETSPEAWNGMPIVIDHPEIEGESVTARQAEVFNTRKVGVLLETEAEDGKLRTECWFDEERTKAVDKRVYNAIVKKKKMEVSTGLGGEVEDKKGTFNGTAYTGVVRNFKPDHLAVLPDKIGALSVKQGGGLFTNALSKEPEGFQQVAARSITEAVKGLGITLIENELSFSDVSRTLCDLLSSEYGEPGKYWSGYVVDVFEGYVVFRNGDTTYRQDYTSTNDQIALTGEPVEVRRTVSYVTNASETEMAKKLSDKKKFVDRLITNGVAAEGDREKLMATDESILAMFETELDAKEAEVAKGKAKPELVTNEEKPKVKMTEEEWLDAAPKRLKRVLNRAEKREEDEKEKHIAVILNAEGNKFKKEWLENQDPDTLEGMAEIASKSQKGAKKKGDADEEDEDSPFVTNSRNRFNYEGNAGAFQPAGEDEEEEEDEDVLEPLAGPTFKDPRKASTRD